MTTTVNTAGSVPYPGQWRLARVDMANWGTFNGFQSLPVDRRGLLITGPSVLASRPSSMLWRQY